VSASAVKLRPYAQGDLGLLRDLLGDPVAMRYLGGAETEDALAARHQRYLHLDPASNWVFVIESERRAVGWIGFWRTSVDTCEVGWHVVRELQGHGIATAALAQAIELARGACRYLEAFPALDNVASNALCRRAGFSDLGQVDVEYPKGQMMRAIRWRLDLALGRSG
jgi:RimJ/RimL family protein N-acetyltransferase